jgi:hypothetical protein
MEVKRRKQVYMLNLPAISCSCSLSASALYMQSEFLSVIHNISRPKPTAGFSLGAKLFQLDETLPSIGPSPSEAANPQTASFLSRNTRTWYLCNASPSTNCTLSLGGRLKIALEGVYRTSVVANLKKQMRGHGGVAYR